MILAGFHIYGKVAALTDKLIVCLISFIDTYQASRTKQLGMLSTSAVNLVGKIHSTLKTKDSENGSVFTDWSNLDEQ